MTKNFDLWNRIKKDIEFSEDKTKAYPHEGEVWICSVGKNIGFEQDGGGEDFSRPVLVIKRFGDKMFWTIPLSTKQKPIDFYYNFTDKLDRKVSTILIQLKLTSIKRMRRKLYSLNKSYFSEIIMRIGNFLPKIETPAEAGVSRSPKAICKNNIIKNKNESQTKNQPSIGWYPPK